jgi:YfiH family protein
MRPRHVAIHRDKTVRRVESGSLVYYQFDQWAGDSRLVHGVFTRLGGVSPAPWQSLNLGRTQGDREDHVSENWRRVYAALALDADRACSVWQVHSADTVVVTGPTPGRHWQAKADGMVTDRPGLPLAMRFADCVPVVLYDPVRHALGLAHAGWQGTLLGAGVSALNALVATYGTRPADVQAGIGPSIGPERYQVGEEVVAAVRLAFGPVEGLIHRDADGSARFDLWAANRLALVRAGVVQIEVAGICTATHTEEFFSHRAENGQTGRFGVVAALAG